nr:hypothetical protein [Tanacetum cinerariifolium]
EHEDETVPASVHEDINYLFGRMAFISRRLYGREMAHALVENKGKAKDKFYGKLILELGNEVPSNVEQGMAVMEKLLEKLGNIEDKVILVNVIPPDYVNEVPVVEPNQHYDVLVVPEPVLVDEDEDPKEDE